MRLFQRQTRSLLKSYGIMRGDSQAYKPSMQDHLLSTQAQLRLKASLLQQPPSTTTPYPLLLQRHNGCTIDYRRDFRQLLLSPGA